MRQDSPLSVVFPNARLSHAVDPHVKLRAVLALVEVPVSHLRVAVELRQRQVSETLEATLHPSTEVASDKPAMSGRTNGSRTANGISSSVSSVTGGYGDSSM